MGHGYFNTIGWGAIIKQEDLIKILKHLSPNYKDLFELKHSCQMTEDYLLGCCNENLSKKYNLRIPNLDKNIGPLIKEILSDKIEFPEPVKKKNYNDKDYNEVHEEYEDYDEEYEENTDEEFDNDFEKSKKEEIKEPKLKLKKEMTKIEEEELDKRLGNRFNKWYGISFSTSYFKSTLCDIARDLIYEILKKIDHKNNKSKYGIIRIEYEEQYVDQSNIMFINVGGSKSDSRGCGGSYYKINTQPPSNFGHLMNILHSVPDLKMECEGFISFSYEGS